jgi:hypothetical protein
MPGPYPDKPDYGTGVKQQRMKRQVPLPGRKTGPKPGPAKPQGRGGGRAPGAGKSFLDSMPPSLLERVEGRDQGIPGMSPPDPDDEIREEENEQMEELPEEAVEGSPEEIERSLTPPRLTRDAEWERRITEARNQLSQWNSIAIQPGASTEAKRMKDRQEKILATLIRQYEIYQEGVKQ